jgi:succinoglycan biosynthesis transport protein ExoP
VTLSEYVAALRRGWVVILVTVLVALVCAGVVTLRKPDVYSATTRLFVASAVGSEKPEELYQRNLIAASRVASYVAVINGNVVADRVQEELGDESVDASVSVTALPETVVLEVTATSSTAEGAAEVARAYAAVVPKVIDEIERVGDDPAQVRVTTIDEAEVPSAPVASAVVPTFAAAGILGLGLGLSIVFVRATLRRERDEAEAASATARTGSGDA